MGLAFVFIVCKPQQKVVDSWYYNSIVMDAQFL